MVIAAATETPRGKHSHTVGAHAADGHWCWRSRRLPNSTKEMWDEMRDGLSLF
jgi:hypothetical protein